MFLILEGELRFGNERFAIRKHEVIACPPGGPEGAHQIINTGETTRATTTTVRGRNGSARRRPDALLKRRRRRLFDVNARALAPSSIRESADVRAEDRAQEPRFVRSSSSA